MAGRDHVSSSKGGPMADTTPDRYILVSTDSHAGADLLDYRAYLPTRWHDDFDAWAADYQNPWEIVGGADNTQIAMPGVGINWDGAARNAANDREGIAAEVLFPNTIPPFFPSFSLFGTIPEPGEYERRWAGLQAHNRWLADFCAEEPTRRIGLAQILPNSMDDAITEIHWAADHGLRGIVVGAIPPGHATVAQFYERFYDPMWRACAEVGFPVCQHQASGAPASLDPRDPVARAVTFTEYGFYASRTLTALVFGGVFERHPDLKFVFAEMGAEWVPPQLTMLDGYWALREGAPAITAGFVVEAMQALSMSPSDYFARNCYLGTFLTVTEVAQRSVIGSDRMMWAADFPHEEGTYPHSREALRWTLAGVPADERRDILGLTAAKVFDLDVATLQQVANRIGPTIDELAQPIDFRPRTARPSYSFRGLDVEPVPV
jgi:predicted TIM-barrel fold metal-dependent hydrolase